MRGDTHFKGFDSVPSVYFLFCVNYIPDSSRHQRLFLLNDSADHSIHFQAMILGEHSDFEVRLLNHLFCQLGICYLTKLDYTFDILDIVRLYLHVPVKS